MLVRPHESWEPRVRVRVRFRANAVRANADDASRGLGACAVSALSPGAGKGCTQVASQEVLEYRRGRPPRYQQKGKVKKGGQPRARAVVMPHPPFHAMLARVANSSNRAFSPNVLACSLAARSFTGSFARGDSSHPFCFWTRGPSGTGSAPRLRMGGTSVTNYCRDHDAG